MRDQLKRRGLEKEIATSKGFNLIYRLVVSLPFCPIEKTLEVWFDAVKPIIEAQDEDISAEAKNWIDYFEATYVGKSNLRCETDVSNLELISYIYPTGSFTKFYTSIL